jgi:hypothetical protein
MRRKVFFLIAVLMAIFGVFATFAQVDAFMQVNPVVKVEQG